MTNNGVTQEKPGGETRKLQELRKGDIVFLDIPFEENTRDYYNGYTPEEIRGKPFTDRFGRSSKERMVIYIGRDGKHMSYLPLTSKSADTEHDKAHQYELKDNSMTLRGTRKRRSFVEVDSLRCIKLKYDADLPYTGRIRRDDLENLLHRIANNTLQFDSDRDQRGYIPNYMPETFEEELHNRGYELTKETPLAKTFTKEGTTKSITRTKYGVVHYHNQMTKQEVCDLVGKREGKHLTLPEPKEQTEAVIRPLKRNKDPQKRKRPSFSETVEQLSKTEETKSYGYTAY